MLPERTRGVPLFFCVVETMEKVKKRRIDRIKFRREWR